LDASYPLVFFDAIQVNIHDKGLVRHKAVYLARRRADGTKDILDLWTETTKGATNSGCAS
jgi:putative transposase